MALELPQNMSSNDQLRALEILGLGTSSKFLSNAYSLGGYSGLEVSLSTEWIDTSEMAQLGTSTSPTQQVLLPTLTIGKGLYNNSDLFIHFSPPSPSQDINRFATSFRWGFYQSLFLPISFSAVVHGGISSVKSKISTKTLGGDLLMGVTLSQLSLFLGGGYVRSSGNFTGGSSGLTLSNNTEYQKIESSHMMFGATYDFEPFFIGASLDRYVDLVYSMKIGFLF